MPDPAPSVVRRKATRTTAGDAPLILASLVATPSNSGDDEASVRVGVTAASIGTVWHQPPMAASGKSRMPHPPEIPGSPD